MKEFVGHPTATAKRTHLSISKRPNSKFERTNRTSSNQTHKPSTRGSSRRRRAAATPSRSTASDSLPLPQLPIPLPSDSSQNHGTFVPHTVLNQLSNALQHLTSSMQANNTPATGNAESTRTIEDGTPNDESPLTVENSTLNVDYTDALSERGLRTTATWYLIRFYTYSSPYLRIWAVLYYLEPT